MLPIENLINVNHYIGCLVTTVASGLISQLMLHTLFLQCAGIVTACPREDMPGTYALSWNSCDPAA